MLKLSRRVTSKNIRGVNYEIVSHYKMDDKNIFIKTGEMIKNDFLSGKLDNIANKNLLDIGIDKNRS